MFYTLCLLVQLDLLCNPLIERSYLKLHEIKGGGDNMYPAEIIRDLTAIVERQQEQIEQLQKDCKYNYDLIRRLMKALRGK